MSFNNDFFNDRNDDEFFKDFDKTVKSAAGGFLKMGLGLLILNLLFWGAIIAMVVFGLTFIF